MENISDLIKEAKPLYLRRKRNRNVAKFTSSLMVVILLCFSFSSSNLNNSYNFYDMYEIYDNIDLTQNGSIIEDLGLPTDKYGFLRIS